MQGQLLQRKLELTGITGYQERELLKDVPQVFPERPQKLEQIGIIVL